MRITGKYKIKQILEEYPVSLDVFFSNGFSYKSKEDLLELLGEDTMLQTVLQVRNISMDLFLYHLENAILISEQEKKYVLEDFNLWDSLDFYGNTICPLKFTFKDGLEELEKAHVKKTGEHRKCYVEAGKNSNDSCDELWTDLRPELFPGVLLTKEFNQYLGRDFQKNMMEKKILTADLYDSKNLNPKMLEAGILDPKREYAVYAVMADVLLVDESRLGALPVPMTREQLLDPVYKDNIILFGKDRSEISNATFLYIYKEFAMDGIKKLANNVKHALHGSQMSKIAGSKNQGGAAIYIVSWFFAKTCVNPNTTIVWPKDGSMTLPMYMLIRSDKKEQEKDIIEYILGDEFARSCAKAYTPHINGNIDDGLDENQKLAWLGWDFIREHDIPELAEQCKNTFFKEWDRLHPEGRMFL